MSATAPSAAVLSFPRADLRGLLNSALKRHRLPDTLAAALVRDAARFPEIPADAALAFALDTRMAPQPIDFDKARGILLVGPAGAGTDDPRMLLVGALRRGDSWESTAVPDLREQAEQAARRAVAHLTADRGRTGRNG